LDWANQPLAFKIYTSLEPLGLPLSFDAAGSSVLDLTTVARLCYFSNGITRVLRRAGGSMPFRAAACTGALYHIELYLITSDRADLPAGVYHYGPHDNALRQLRQGDYRGALITATDSEQSIAHAPVVMAFTTTFWRNAWKYQARAYRHAFWDTGTILANLLSVAAANGIPSNVVFGFADAQVNALLDVDPSQEATVCLVSLGAGSAEPPSPPSVEILDLPTQPLSARRVDYPEISEAHNATSLSSGEAAAAWRRPADIPWAKPAHTEGETVEAVILRRGSSRRFSTDPLSTDQLKTLTRVATTPIASDVAGMGNLTDPYLIVNAVDGLEPGAYFYNRQANALELLKQGDFRRHAAFLDFGQPLAGDAAANVYWLADLEAVSQQLGERGYRAAQLEAAIEGGMLYLAAYALGLGATGLTFFDDEVTRFFSPHAAGKSVMFLTAVGRPAPSSRKV
jgi:SagB-type dehydrogenase family enzyme